MPAPDAHEPDRSGLIRRLRGVAFVALTAFIVLGPAKRQLFGKRDPMFRAWVMFSGIALNLVEVRYERMLPSGERVEVDRFEALGTTRRRAPKDVRRIVRKRGLESVNRRLCRRLGSETDLRVHARIATKRGWKSLADGERNVCPSGEVGSP